MAFLFIGGIQLVSVGMIGEYIGRIYSEDQDRTLYVIHEEIGVDVEQARKESWNLNKSNNYMKVEIGKGV